MNFAVPAAFLFAWLRTEKIAWNFTDVYVRNWAKFRFSAEFKHSAQTRKDGCKYGRTEKK